MSPSITEIIAQKKAQEEREEWERRNVKSRHQQEEELRLQKAEESEAQRRKDKQRELALKAERVFNNFGVLEGLEEIRRDFLSGVKKKDLIISLEFGRVELIWGNKYKLDHGIIEYERSGFLGLKQVKDYSSIEVVLREDDTLEIIRERGNVFIRPLPQNFISRSQTNIGPSYSKDKIKEAIADCYLFPRRVKEHYEPPSASDYSSSSSSNCECCCECGAG